MAERTESPAEITATEALQKALLAEHAAVYGYGFVGANSPEAEQERAAEHLDAHRQQRDIIRGLLIERNADPAPAAGAYDLPTGDGAMPPEEFATVLERRTAASYLELAAVRDTALREFAGRALQMATVRSLTWGAQLRPFPGFPDGEV